MVARGPLAKDAVHCAGPAQRTIALMTQAARQRALTTHARRNACCLLAATLLAGAAGAPAQTAVPLAAREPGSDLTVYLMTIGPGAAVWEKFIKRCIRT